MVICVAGACARASAMTASSAVSVDVVGMVAVVVVLPVECTIAMACAGCVLYGAASV